MCCRRSPPASFPVSGDCASWWLVTHPNGQASCLPPSRLFSKVASKAAAQEESTQTVVQCVY